MSRRAALGALAAAVVGGCASRPAAPPVVDDAAERYVRVALQLAQHQPRLVDGWIGPADWRPGPRVPVQGLATELEALLGVLEPVAASDPQHAERARYLLGQVRALYLAARRLLGQSMPLAVEAQMAFGRPMPAVDHELARSAREALDLRLPGTGPLGPRLEAFRRQEIVPAGRATEVFERALEACRRVTREALALPDDERTEVSSTDGLAWDGFCRYQGGRRSLIEINSDGAPAVSRLLHLAAHEGYPGHHVQYVVTDTALVEARGWPEFALLPAFGPHLLLAEGAAEVALDLAFPDPDRERLYADVLLPSAGLPPDRAKTMVEVERLAIDVEPVVPEIVAAYLDGEADTEQTMEQLSQESLVADPRAFLPFAERQRTTVYAYPVGRQLVDAWLSASPGSTHWARLDELYRTWTL